VFDEIKHSPVKLKHITSSKSNILKNTNFVQDIKIQAMLKYKISMFIGIDSETSNYLVRTKFVYG